MGVLNLSRAEEVALRRVLPSLPPSPPLESIRRKLEARDRPAEHLVGQMDVYEYIEESR
jgi:hypothetical protein